MRAGQPCSAGRDGRAAAALTGAHRHEGRPAHRGDQPPPRKRGVCHLQAENRRAWPGHEARRCGVQLRGQQDHVFLHVRRACGFPRAGQGSGLRVPQPHRAAPDRRSRRGEDARRHRHLRPPILLQSVSGRLSARVHEDGEGAVHVAQPVEDLRRVRPSDVLPAL